MPKYILKSWRYYSPIESKHENLDDAVYLAVCQLEAETAYPEKIICPDGREIQKGELDNLIEKISNT